MTSLTAQWTKLAPSIVTDDVGPSHGRSSHGLAVVHLGRLGIINCDLLSEHVEQERYDLYGKLNLIKLANLASA